LSILNTTYHKPYLDGWRGLAILLVLIGHFAPNDYINLGRLGVDLFFVLSGHLMAQLLFIKKVDLKQFYKRRISRIFPAMIVFLLGSLLIAPWLGLKIEPQAFFMASSFTINYVHALGLSSSHLYEHFWSLSVEEHSYVLLGLVAFFCRKMAFSPVWIIFALACGAILNGFTSTLYFKQSFYQSYWRSDVACGAILISAFLTTRNIQLKSLSWVLLGILGLCILYLSMNRFPLYAVKYSIGTAILAFIVVNLDKTPILLQKFLALKPLTFLGTISYSLYLWQQLFYVAIPTFGVALMLSCTFIAALMSYYFIEKPARAYLNERW
jgi:peptidoglycan/LPS O-acetylase OafA/YrhL